LSGVQVPQDHRRLSYTSIASSGGKRGSLSLIGEGLGLGEIGLGLGMGIGEEDNRGREGEQEVRDREWRETVRNLLLVVDGMVSTPSLSLVVVGSKVG